MEIQGGLKCDALELSAPGVLKCGRASVPFSDIDHGVVFEKRTRVTLAEMNAGATLLPAQPGVRYRLSGCIQISVGGNMAATAAATGTAIYGTQAGSAVKMFEVLLAAGTRSSPCRPGVPNCNELADGAIFMACDPNTAITCKAVSPGAFDLITATAFDVTLSYVMET